MTIFNEDFELSVTVSLNDPCDEQALLGLAAKKLKMDVNDLPSLEIKKQSIDARHGKVSLVFTLGITDKERYSRIHEILTKEVKGEPVIIIGGGPAGLFCAYELARRGQASILCERGKMVQARRKDLKGLNQHGIVDENSNYCFGEGGAGTYSDGKLYTRSHKRGSVREILEILVAHGAKPEILVDARPHIGSNKLPKVITAMRESLQRVGVRFLFDAQVVDILLDNKKACGVRLADGQQIAGKAVVIATGHSARDVYHMLFKLGVQLEAKPFAMGVRIEHPQNLINRIQYGKSFGHPKLPAAYYRLAYTPKDGRGAFSFCMCPGGWIVPASTNQRELVVNGMSLSRRDSPFANSGLVVAVSIKDLMDLKLTNPLGGLELQARLESTAMNAGGGALVAPACRVTDFMAHTISQDLPDTSYIPGIRPADIHEVLASTNLPLAQRLKEAIVQFNRLMPGYISPEAILVGVESRTSSPVRVVRDPENLCSNILGLYPCGEGAGYAGGIVSAAMDGMNVATAIAQAL
jgi:uncharacterized protein